jgi:hypothetical protein
LSVDRLNSKRITNANEPLPRYATPNARTKHRTVNTEHETFERQMCTGMAAVGGGVVAAHANQLATVMWWLGVEQQQ